MIDSCYNHHLRFERCQTCQPDRLLNLYKDYELGYWDEGTGSIEWTSTPPIPESEFLSICYQLFSLPRDIVGKAQSAHHVCSNQPLVFFTRQPISWGYYYIFCNNDLVAVRKQNGDVIYHMPHPKAQITRHIQSINLHYPTEDGRVQNSSNKPQHTDLADSKPGDTIQGLGDENSTWAMGAKGEKLTGDFLDSFALQHGGKVLHSIPLKRSDIDHLLIMPQGVYSVNTKTSKGKVAIGRGDIFVNGVQTYYPNDEWQKSLRLTKMLTTALNMRTPVTPLIMYHADNIEHTENSETTPDRAKTFTSLEEFSKLLDNPTILTSHQIDRIWKAARKPATWL